MEHQLKSQCKCFVRVVQAEIDFSTNRVSVHVHLDEPSNRYIAAAPLVLVFDGDAIVLGVVVVIVLLVSDDFGI